MGPVAYLPVPIAVDQFHGLEPDPLYNLLSIDSHIVLVAVVRLCIRSDLLQVREELPARPVVLVLKSLQEEVKPHFLGDYLAVLGGDLLLYSLLEIDEVLLILQDVLIQVLLQFRVLVLVEPVKVSLHGGLGDKHDVPQVDSQGLVGLRRLQATLVEIH